MAQNKRIQKDTFVTHLAERMNTDTSTAEAWIEGFTETLFAEFEKDNGVTIKGFGGFYLRRSSRSNTTIFKFNPGQRLRALLGWSSTYKG